MFDNYPLFLAACVVLAITPGPNLLYLVSRTLCQGRAAGLLSLAGTTSGFIVHILAASLGLSAVLIAMPVLFDVVRFAGAAYLLWLAWDSVRARGASLFTPRPLAPERPSRLYRTGFVTTVLNPKVALFFLAFVPQFIDADAANKPLAFLVLGCIFNFNGMLWCNSLAIFTAFASARLKVKPLVALWLNRATGSLFIALGARLALAEQH